LFPGGNAENYKELAGKKGLKIFVAVKTIISKRGVALKS